VEYRDACYRLTADFLCDETRDSVIFLRRNNDEAHTG
jgi:hypothetical protein